MVSHKSDFIESFYEGHSFKDHIARMKKLKEWGGHREIIALARALNIVITLFMDHDLSKPAHIFNQECSEINAIVMIHRSNYHYETVGTQLEFPDLRIIWPKSKDNEPNTPESSETEESNKN